jgi:DNA modification methylase
VQEEVSPDMDEAEQFGLMAQLVLAKQATFDKPAKNRHMRLLYLRGYVNGKPLTKMFVDGGAAVNVMPYTTFISANLDSSFREELIKLLKEYKDCFAWDYSEMPGSYRSIVQHRLPIKPGFRPCKQPPRKIYMDEVLADV